ncbi:hypothetical protein [Diaphorobacter sp.]|uniref:hypothetical protein n=1 Tax=Diaphorobacter sp. TaxID=1934310 RepID=UPI0028AF788B|nr:hypothetical protein [Diaphorobacter sp.]
MTDPARNRAVVSEFVSIVKYAHFLLIQRAWAAAMAARKKTNADSPKGVSAWREGDEKG